MEVNGYLQVLAALPPEKNPGIQCIGGWVGPRAGLDFSKRDPNKFFLKNVTQINTI